jgi:hypothetical protein
MKTVGSLLLLLLLLLLLSSFSLSLYFSLA